MSDFSMFFAGQSSAAITEEFVVAVRFKNAEGSPGPWKLRSITEEENQECRKAATRKVKGKNGVFTPEIDPNDYMA
ncbi:phage portal protein, partial [Clostridium perfringens]